MLLTLPPPDAIRGFIAIAFIAEGQRRFELASPWRDRWSEYSASLR